MAKDKTSFKIAQLQAEAKQLPSDKVAEIVANVPKNKELMLLCMEVPFFTHEKDPSKPDDEILDGTKMCTVYSEMSTVQRENCVGNPIVLGFNCKAYRDEAKKGKDDGKKLPSYQQLNRRSGGIRNVNVLS
eukprot:scaffold7775_cov61-Cyclotella_meneghiniana.AAC.6